jgi:hypothetical protein
MRKQRAEEANLRAAQEDEKAKVLHIVDSWDAAYHLYSGALLCLVGA